jgi:hypothetical protein
VGAFFCVDFKLSPIRNTFHLRNGNQGFAIKAQTAMSLKLDIIPLRVVKNSELFSLHVHEVFGVLPTSDASGAVNKHWSLT